MIWNLVLIGGFLHLAVVLQSQIRFLKQMESRLDVRITKLETLLGDLRDCVHRIEETLAASKESCGGTVSDARALAPDPQTLFWDSAWRGSPASMKVRYRSECQPTPEANRISYGRNSR